MSLAEPLVGASVAAEQSRGDDVFRFFDEAIAPVALPTAEPPLLQVVVDTEEEFDWSRPFSRKTTGVRNVAHQLKAQPIFERFGIKPTYVVDHPVASQSIGYGPLRELLVDGRCDIGAHLQPWVNPPFVEDVNYLSSYPGNLPPEIEREKLLVLTDTIERNFGVRPLIYRAGRYGLGPRSFALLDRLGYEIDASVLPGVDLTRRFGPDFSAFGPQPFRFGANGRRLGIPLTVAHIGALASHARAFYPWLDTRSADRLMLKAAASRLRLMERIQLTPEGFTLAEQRRLVRALLARGQRVFNLSYHSPSLMPGGAPYVRDADDLARFFDRLEGLLDFFVNEVKGRFITPLDLKRRIDRAPVLAYTNPH